MRRAIYGASLPAVKDGEAAMDVLALRKRQPIYIAEMMERLGIEPAGGVVPRLSLSYAENFVPTPSPSTPCLIRRVDPRC
jgi:hypothetical protein